MPLEDRRGVELFRELHGRVTGEIKCSSAGAAHGILVNMLSQLQRVLVACNESSDLPVAAHSICDCRRVIPYELE